MKFARHALYKVSTLCRTKWIVLAISQMSAFVQVFGRRHDEGIDALSGRRPKSAKARNRGERSCGGGSASAMGIWPCGLSWVDQAR
jgi:hypothetical protein